MLRFARRLFVVVAFLLPVVAVQAQVPLTRQQQTNIARINWYDTNMKNYRNLLQANLLALQTAQATGNKAAAIALWPAVSQSRFEYFNGHIPITSPWTEAQQAFMFQTFPANYADDKIKKLTWLIDDLNTQPRKALDEALLLANVNQVFVIGYFRADGYKWKHQFRNPPTR